MKSLQDALYNWLSIKVVSDERPDDLSAIETTELFETILTMEHGINNIHVSKDERMYFVQYEKDGEEKISQFPIEYIEVMLNQIKAEPDKWKIYPNE
ncbi:hypothetical protein [Neobacillus sp. LXY-4]|uniref:hypothetical protein n=1 Tax=Neobacillus sp. LXY-4 TaxID=3379826 RepID=UPI003EDEEC35